VEVEFELKRAREIAEDDRWSSRLEMLITVLLGIAPSPPPSLPSAPNN